MSVNTVTSPDMKRKQRVPPNQKSTSRFPVLHYGKVPKIDINSWTFEIRGEVEEKKILSFAQFKNLSNVMVRSDIHCVTGWSRLDNEWEGVPAKALLELVNIKPSAKYVMVHAFGGFTANLSLEDFFQGDVIFALKHNGKTLTPDHGFPVRLVVPRLYFWKSAKWVTGVEFMLNDKRGFWERNGYHNRGDPWKEERYAYD